jgi:hypothetical protein
MKSDILLRTASLSALLALGAFASGCGGGGAAPAPHTHADGSSHDDHDHDHDHDHAGESAPMEDGHSGVVTQLGEQPAGAFTVKASRDGEIKAGSDAPVDIWVSGGSPVAAVRFWIGTEDGQGSVKAKAEIEGDHWHTHCDVPSPLPAGAKLWVEVEAESGEKSVCSFELKA